MEKKYYLIQNMYNKDKRYSFFQSKARCGIEKYPGVYGRVSYYKGWINKIQNKNCQKQCIAKKTCKGRKKKGCKAKKVSKQHCKKTCGKKYGKKKTPKSKPKLRLTGRTKPRKTRGKTPGKIRNCKNKWSAKKCKKRGTKKGCRTKEVKKYCRNTCRLCKKKTKGKKKKLKRSG